MSWEAENSIEGTASPEAVWELWANVDRWPEWNERIEGVELDGRFEVGSSLKIKQKGGGTLHATLTEVEPEHGFTYEARLPGARLEYGHRVEGAANGAEITNRVSIGGPMGGLWRLMMGRRAEKALPDALERQRELAERG